MSVLASAVVAAVAAASPTTAIDAGPGTTLELALAERACALSAGATPLDADAQDECVQAQIAAFRADFGRDMRRLQPAERQALDSKCSRLNSALAREAYLDCLNEGLIALRTRRTAGVRQAAPKSASRAATAAVADKKPVRPVGVPIQTIVASAVVIAVFAGILFYIVKSELAGRQPVASVPEPVASVTSTQRLPRPPLEDLQRQFEYEQERQRQAARLEEELRRREAEETRRLEAETRQLEEETRRRQLEEEAALSRHERTAAAESTVSVESVFDPYAVLGVARDADRGAIRAAYETARSKYNPDIVSHLGEDVQEHYRAKAQAIDRAYQTIA